MSLASQIALLATRVALEFKSVRDEIEALSDPWTQVISDVEAANTSATTSVGVPNLIIPTSLAVGVYEIEAVIRAKTSLNTNAVRFGMFIPTESKISYQWIVPNSATATTFLHNVTTLNFTGNTAFPSASPIGFITTMKALMIVESALSSSPDFRFRSEVEGETSTVLVGSYARWRKIM